MIDTPMSHFSARATLFAGLLVCGPALGAFTSDGFMIAVGSSAGNALPTNTVTPVSSTTWMSNGEWSAAGTSVSWMNNTQGWNPATNSGFINGNFVVRNETTSAHDYTITIGMTGSAVGPLVVGGSIGGQFLNTSLGLGSLTSLGGLWTVHVDETLVRSELNNTLVTAPSFQIASLGSSNFSGLVVPRSSTSNISIQFNFRMSGGSEASFTSTIAFQAVPTPGAAALVCLAGVLGRRRRRR